MNPAFMVFLLVSIVVITTEIAIITTENSKILTENHEFLTELLHNKKPAKQYACG
jgi:hypothetical protein